MKGAAAARLGKDQTPGWTMGSEPRYTAEAPTASARPTSSGRSPTTQEAVRSRLSAAAAAESLDHLRRYIELLFQAPGKNASGGKDRPH